MENQKNDNKKQILNLQQRLNNAILNLEQKPLIQSTTIQCLPLINSLYPQDSNLNMSLNEKIRNKISESKVNILQQVLQQFQFLKERQIKILKNKLKILTYQQKFLIKQGIIIIYSDLTQIKQKQESCGNGQFALIIERILDALSPLLKKYFVVKEIQKYEQKQRKQNSSLRQIFSSNKIVNLQKQQPKSMSSANSIKQLLIDAIALQASKSIDKKSIKQLINQELKHQQSEMDEVIQTCRICNRNFRLKKIENHIIYCTKMQNYRIQKQDMLKYQNNLIAKIRQKLEKTNNDNKPLYNQEQLAIYESIIISFQRFPKIDRRNSLNSMKNKRKIHNKIFTQIQHFLQSHNNNKIVKEYKNLLVQKQKLERKFINFQKNSFNDAKSSQGSDTSSKSLSQYRKTLKSLKTSKLLSVKTKKSLFAKKQSSSSSFSDRQIKESIQQQGKHRVFSIKNHMDEIFNDSDTSSDEWFQEQTRLCKSLANFKKQEDQTLHQICINDFQILKFIGKGAFGKVYLVRRIKTLDIYALKVIKINSSWDQKQLRTIKNQHEILSQIDGKHLVKAPFSFTQGSAHFFVLQYVPGGDLSKFIEQQVYLDYKQAQFYLAQIVLAIQKLHQLGIIHRDLKPQNLIIDQDGHLKLTDFGLSEIRINDKIQRVKKNNGKRQQQNQQNAIDDGKVKVKSARIQAKNTQKIIGTPDYIAPQIISGQSMDNLSIDWWSLGVIAYQMMIGCRPFCAKTVDQVIKNIQQFNIQWPEIGEEDDMIAPAAADFIQKLLNKNFSQRLGASSVQQIKSHKFFQGLNWQQIKQMRPPLMPVIDKKQNYQNIPQASQLKHQIKIAIGGVQAKSSFKLDNFVRYDILAQQTLESADKKIIKRETKIKKLRSIASNFGNQSGQNKESKAQIDEQIELCWKNSTVEKEMY